jgi:hypothetical protein
MLYHTQADKCNTFVCQNSPLSYVPLKNLAPDPGELDFLSYAKTRMYKSKPPAYPGRAIDIFNVFL